MPRRIVRIDNSIATIAIESPFESEMRLHSAVSSHPEVLPSEDLNLGPLVALATELDMGSGPMDLLASDPQGRLIIVEFKRGTENPDVREVVAQMLDYGSSLWRTPYSELQEAVGRRQSTGFVALTEMVKERFAKLDVQVDEEAFVNGVTACLERGNFVFMYVVRDLDQRTLRVITYLADGAQMTFFAVEVDNFTDKASGNSVLVPRTAFIPSWVASGEPANARRSTASTYDVSTASPEVQSFVKSMDELAPELKLQIRRAPAGPHYDPAVREAGVSFGMGVGVNVAKQAADFNLLAFRQRGHEEVADDMLDRIRRVTGMTKMPPSWPSVPVAPLVKDWSATKREIIVPYFRARAAQAADTPPNPST